MKILVGEMARLHNVSTQTLRYYDKIGLLQPKYIDKENGYRYYTIEQFAHLDSIILLKKIGVPLKKIKEYFASRDVEGMLELLKTKESLLQKEIKVLRRKCKDIQNKINRIETYRRKEDFHQCKVKYIPFRQIAYLDFGKKGNLVDFEYGLKELSSLVGEEAYHFQCMIAGILSREQVLKGEYYYWENVGILFEEEVLQSDAKVLPKGEYATITFKGNVERGVKDYEKLIKWIKEKGYKIIGDGLLLTITDSSYSEFEDEFIIEIQIPVK
ncbi:DNA-binding transcriptional regulator, MerR family [Anaerovirgula multivorans]|uniref:DNA-binding transcriptional regulator, MerR family n=1 Tax=Anaerovirgula multivorans TaxID=312168 RepID=A0A239BDW3_9FIRM|nr:MerR family transcriptional regulator [Anaerovirgula multivorans]SNS05751.1 DNA-binding transcriptional regulator, MerR family [Anaerovirgula multivorans]